MTAGVSAGGNLLGHFRWVDGDLAAWSGLRDGLDGPNGGRVIVMLARRVVWPVVPRP